ncbi:MAG: hypothetical protein JRF65_02020 [Deltaproteobacteria bacterium]|nr:hypothetical protein [Deltaproteobacteria bacterium]
MEQVREGRCLQETISQTLLRLKNEPVSRYYRMGDIVFHAQTDALLPDTLQARFDPFLISETTPHARQVIRMVRPISKTETPASRGVDSHGLRRAACFRFPELAHSLTPQENENACVSFEISNTCIFSFDFSNATSHLIYSPEAERIAYLQFMAVFFAPLFSRFSSALVHSSSFLCNGSVGLFLAPDEGGKTTTVASAPKGSVLSDDQNLLRLEQDGYNVYGTPWGLTSNARAKGKLGAFFILEKAQQFRLDPAGPREALQYLWGEHASYRCALPMQLRKKAFDLVYGACHAAPVYRLMVPKDEMDWDAIKNAMQIR